ncbi:initiation factor 3g [Nannochloropsis gaditana]|uniref:Initiation factor 3g n=1 Tax=Nannochloropsis gaditana TaxID=72520 RepID=W7TZR7_9STRA|nr:initiation factor 3g [Nannochloropsis gaditana]
MRRVAEPPIVVVMSREVQDWGDYEDDEELPQPVEGKPDENGVVTRTEWAWKDQRKVRYVQKFKVEEITTHVPKRTFVRKTWARFGDARDAHVRAEEQSIAIEDPHSLAEDEPAADLKNLGLIQQKLAARKAGLLPSTTPGESFAEYDGGSGIGGMNGGEEGAPRRTMGERFGGGGPGPQTGPGGREEDKFPTIRVTNVSEDTTDDDLKNLFGRFGVLHRVFLAKDKERNTSRGFAFVSFLKKEDAQKAMDSLQGYGYDHLILRLEWANPPTQRREERDGLAGGFVSGYGQRLAQDTTMAYSTASNLTHGTER